MDEFDDVGISPDELEAELGAVVTRGRRLRARRRAAMAGSLAMATVVALVGTALALRGPDEQSDVRAVDQPGQATSTSSTTSAPSTSVPATTVVTTTTTVPLTPPPPFAVIVREVREDAVSEVVLVDGKTGEDIRTIYTTGGGIRAVSLSPDRAFVYFVEQFCGSEPVKRVRVDGPPTQTPEVVTDAPSADPEVSPDGRSLAYIGYGECADDSEQRGPSLRVRNLATRMEQGVARPQGDWVLGSPTWSPDGRSLAVSMSRGDAEAFVAILDPSKQNDPLAVRRVSSPRAGFGYSSPAWLPDGTLFVIEVPLGANVGKAGARMVRVDGGTGAVLATVATGDAKRRYTGADADVTGRHLLYLSAPDAESPAELRVSSNGGRTTVLATGVTAADW